MEPLIDQIKTTLSKNKVEKLAKIAAEELYTVKDLIDLSFHTNQQISFRSAWILENVFFNYQHTFLPNVLYFLEKFPFQNNLSALRHYVKILAFMTNKNASPEIKKIITEVGAESLKDLGKVMGTASKTLAGKSDGKSISEMVKKLLS